jgi:UDP-N-acetylmuramoyl-tripeptide--D-alanyl-D-alanine ligase
MKTIIKKIIFTILKIEAQLVLWRYRPKIVAITGTVGKTSTKDAIYHGLSSVLHVRKNNKSMNSEIGVPLTILGLESGWNNLGHWLKNIVLGFTQIFYKSKYPKWLVLETGIDNPGDMKRTASWLKPDVAVVTNFAKVPSHVENFDSPEDVMEEEGSLMDYLKPDGILILNTDDEDVAKLKGKSKNKVYTYGTKDADLTASNYSINYTGYDNNHPKPEGISFKVDYQGHSIPINVNKVIGDQFIYPILAAVTVGVALDISAVDISSGFTQMKFAPGRMNLLEGENDTLLIDDTYNSSPIAVKKALDTLSKIESQGMKIAVLGDMLEIGHFSASEHRKVGEMAVSLGIDVLITVGFRSKSTVEAAIDKRMAKGKVFNFEKSEDAIETVREYLQAGNIILVKGSQGIRMEKITKNILKDKDKAKDLLIRQESVWQTK